MKIKKWNKKAVNFLGENTLKIVVGVLCLFVLIIFLWKIITNLNKTDVEQAKASLEIITSMIKPIEEGKIQEKEFVIESPKEWYIVVWPYPIGYGGEKIPQCIGESCVCLCDDDDCNGKTFCKTVSKKIKIIEEGQEEKSLKIEEVFSLKASLSNNEIVFEKMHSK